MDRFIDFYKNRHNHEVIAVHERPEVEFEAWLHRSPHLPRGWWELACLPSSDRIEFMTLFWSMRFPYSPEAQKVIQHFFSRVDDLGIYLVKKDQAAYFLPDLVYSMKDEAHFYHGSPPATKEEMRAAYHTVQSRLPEEYVSFMKIHNGFAKKGEEGVLPLEKIGQETERVYVELVSGLHPMTFEGEALDPRCLIPFYKTVSGYQCFHKEWYPDQEMGTLGLVLSDHGKHTMCKHHVFPSFLRWFMMYMGAEDV